MRKVCFLTVALAFAIGGAVRAQNGSLIPSGALGSGARQFLEDPGGLGTLANSPFTNGMTNGLGRIVRDWTHDGIHGPELADRIHWLQRMRAEEIAERTRWLEQRRSDAVGRYRVWDRDFRDRDIRDNRRQLGNEESRLGDDRERLGRGREDVRRDLRDRERDDRFPGRHPGRDRDDRFQDRDASRHDRSQERDAHSLRDQDRRRDREEQATGDHDPRRDRADRRRDRGHSVGSDPDVRNPHGRGHEHKLANKDSLGRQMGIRDATRDNHPDLQGVRKADTQHSANFLQDHRSNFPSAKNAHHAVHFGKGKGK